MRKQFEPVFVGHMVVMTADLNTGLCVAELDGSKSTKAYDWLIAPPLAEGSGSGAANPADILSSTLLCDVNIP